MKPIFIYGAPASGKSTLGRRLAKRLSTEFIDLDEEIVRRAGMDIPTLFARDGEAAFRELESRTLRKLELSAPTIVSLGGGTLLSMDNRKHCEQMGAVLCLKTPSTDELSRRLSLSPNARPLGNKAQERATHYASFSNVIDTIFEIDDSLVVVGERIAGAFLGRFPIVADSSVAKLYPEVNPFAVIPSGEEHKTPETVVSLWHEFAGLGLGRNDTVAACGGGVVGDLTGFAAATWMRGIDWVNIPTTLLSMVDASTGGKTGCDLKEGKNLAGAFHSPKFVIIDVEFLKTLPERELASGKAEMIKHCIIAGSPACSTFGGVPTAEEIAANLKVKVDIVAQDPLERNGRRLLLNCGHTVAHAIEKLTDYRVSHGEAVAMGCVEEARLAVRLNLASSNWPKDLSARFASAGLKTDLPTGLSFESMRETMIGDKKRIGDVVTFALPCAWGDVRAVPVDLGKRA